MHPSSRQRARPPGLESVAIATAVGVLSLGCAVEPDWAGSIEERDGVTYVSNPEAGLWQEVEQAPIRFELEQIFGSDGTPRDAMLGEPFRVQFDVDAQGNVYLLDGQTSRLVAFSPEGEVRWTAAGAGEGPGELHRPRGLSASPDGVIAVGNGSSTRLSIWNTAGEYVDSVSLVEPPVELNSARILNLVGFVGDDTLALEAPMWGALGGRVYLVRIDDPPELIGEIGWNQVPELEVPPGLSSGPPARGAPGVVFMGSSAGYRFRVYDATGALQREVTRAVDYPVRSGFYSVEGGNGIAGFGSVSPPLLLPGGSMLVPVSWTAGIDDPDAAALENSRAFREGREPVQRERRSTFDLFDEAGRFLYSMARPDAEDSIGDPRLVGPDGKLYTLASDPFPQVRRYRVVVEPR